MGWWGHGVMDGDDASDAKFTLLSRAFGGEVKPNNFGEWIADEIEDNMIDETLTRSDRSLINAYVQENVNVICKGALEEARESWHYGGTAFLVATAYELVTRYGVKALPKEMKKELTDAFAVELHEAEEFDVPGTRRRCINHAKAKIAKTRTL